MADSLRQRRKALGLRLRDVARQTGVSYGSVWNYENGRPGGVIKDKFQTVLDFYDRMEKEKSEEQDKKSC